MSTTVTYHLGFHGLWWHFGVCPRLHRAQTLSPESLLLWEWGADTWLRIEIATEYLTNHSCFTPPVCSGASGGKCDAPLTTSTSTPPARIVISIKHPTRRAKWLEIGPSFIIFPFFFFFFTCLCCVYSHVSIGCEENNVYSVESDASLEEQVILLSGPAPSASFPPVTRMQFLPCLNKKHCCVMLCTIYACQSAWYSSEYNATQSHMFVWKQPMILSAVWVWFISSFFFLFFFSFPVTHGERSIPALSLSLSPGPWTVSQIDDRGRTRAPRGTLRCGV